MRIGLAGRLVLLCGIAGLPTAQAMKGEVSRASSPERIRLISVSRETSSGMASGKRMHKPITITKEVDASSPMLKQALAKRSGLGDVLIEFEGAGAGAGKAAEKIVLKNAMITGMQMVGGSEQISLDYETIEVTYVNGNKTASDDWETPK
jgi:type VI secretion system secreted protein Hcp